MAPRQDPVTWLVLAYRLPAHSGLKAVIRRRLTAIGAVYPVNSIAALPASPVAGLAAPRALHRKTGPAVTERIGDLRRRIGQRGHRDRGLPAQRRRRGPFPQ